MLLENGRIHTLDARATIADTLVVREGRIAFAGRPRRSTPASVRRSSTSAAAPCFPGSWTRTRT
jgi:predicted amidohydrolase YtcJ